LAAATVWRFGDTIFENLFPYAEITRREGRNLSTNAPNHKFENIRTHQERVPMRMIAYLLSAAATTALVTPAFAQDVPTTQPEAQTATTTSGTAAGSVDAGQAPVAPQAYSGNASDIVITATRRSERLSNVPIAVSAVGSAALENTGANDIR
jgi:hypothetical protein